MIIVHDTSIFKLIGCDEGIVTFMKQFCSVDSLVPFSVAVAFFRQDGLGNTKSDASIDASPLETGLGFALLRIQVKGRDFVSQEVGYAGSCVSDERFLLRKRETQFFT